MSTTGHSARFAALAATATVFLLPAPAGAMLITYDIVATTFTRTDNATDPSLLLPSEVAPGATAIGFITFETDTGDIEPGVDRGRYPSAIVDFQLAINGLLFDYDPSIPGAASQIFAWNRTGALPDIYTLSTRDGYAAYSAPIGSEYSFTLALQANPTMGMGTNLLSDVLLEDLTTIPSWWVTWTIAGPGTTPASEVPSFALANVTSLVRRPTSVPEPSTALLLLAGLGGLSVSRKARARRVA